MRVRGRLSLRDTARKLRYRFASRALILMYHRVVDLPTDPHLLAVTPRHFTEHMEIIRAHCSPIRLQQLVASLRDGKVPNRAVVVTFDDGYVDNLLEAKPLMERFEIPATVFVTAGQVGSQREFWWDELDRLCLQPGTLPSKLVLNFDGSISEWALGEAETYTEDDYRRNQNWHIEREDDPSPRQRLFRMLYSAMSELPPAERRRAMDDLLVRAGAEPVGRATYRALSRDEAILLNQGGLVEVGAHTMTHPALASLTAEEQRQEIRQSKACLEAILQHPVTSFAFPHGSYTSTTVSILAEAGFVCGCASHADAVWRGTDGFQLPRLGVRNWDRETFTRWLRWWMDG